MTFTLGTGMFGHAPAGTASTALPRAGWVYLEPSPRRIRGYLDGRLVVDSRRPMLLYQPGRMVRMYFPLTDLRDAALEPSAQHSHSDVMGQASHVDLRVGERLVRNAGWAYRDGDRDPDLRPYVAFYVRALDEWWEEDLQIRGHARDPYHRVDAVPSSRRVRVSLDGVTLSETDRAVVIFETGLPARWYLPRADITAELTPSELSTHCTFKGQAAYWSARVGGREHPNLAWSYAEPDPAVAAVRDRVCFFNERVDIELDGEPEPRPHTPWEGTDWWRATGDFEDHL